MSPRCIGKASFSTSGRCFSVKSLCARQLMSVQIWRLPSVCTAVHVVTNLAASISLRGISFRSQIFTSGRVKARFLADNRVLSKGVGVWLNSSSRWVVSSAGSLAARLSFWVPVLRLGDPGRDFVWGCDCPRLPSGRKVPCSSSHFALHCAWCSTGRAPIALNLDL